MSSRSCFPAKVPSMTVNHPPPPLFVIWFTTWKSFQNAATVSYHLHHAALIGSPILIAFFFPPSPVAIRLFLVRRRKTICHPPPRRLPRRPLANFTLSPWHSGSFLSSPHAGKIFRGSQPQDGQLSVFFCLKIPPSTRLRYCLARLSLPRRFSIMLEMTKMKLCFRWQKKKWSCCFCRRVLFIHRMCIVRCTAFMLSVFCKLKT